MKCSLYRLNNLYRADQLPVEVDQCPLAWNVTSSQSAEATVEPDDSWWLHLSLYEISYMWFPAIGCIWCLTVGSLISLYKPTDPKTVDKRLISPGLLTIFKFWPDLKLYFV